MDRRIKFQLKVQVPNALNKMGFLKSVVSSAVQKGLERQEMCASIMDYFREHDEVIARSVSKRSLTLIGSEEIFGRHILTEDLEKVVSYLNKQNGYYCVDAGLRTYYFILQLGSLNVRGFNGPSVDEDAQHDEYGGTDDSSYGESSYEMDDEDGTGYDWGVSKRAPAVKKRQRKPLTQEQKEAMLEKRRVTLEKKKKQEEREAEIRRIKREAAVPEEKRERKYKIFKWVISLIVCYFSIIGGIILFVALHYGLNNYFEKRIDKAKKDAVDAYNKEHPEENE